MKGRGFFMYRGGSAIYIHTDDGTGFLLIVSCVIVVVDDGVVYQEWLGCGSDGRKLREGGQRGTRGGGFRGGSRLQGWRRGRYRIHTSRGRPLTTATVVHRGHHRRSVTDRVRSWR